MTEDQSNKKIGKISSTAQTKAVTPAQAVDETQSIDKVQAVGATKSVGALRGTQGISKGRGTHVMTLEEREQLLRTIDEEAAKMFGPGALPMRKKDVITKAVKMAIDSGLLGQEDEEKK